MTELRKNGMRPIHPGEILKHTYLVQSGMYPEELAKLTGISMFHMRHLIAGTGKLVVDDAMKLAKYYDTSPQFWLNLQMAYDIRKYEMENV